MAKKTSKNRGIFKRGDIYHIRFADEEGKIIRESTKQTGLTVAKDILNTRKSDVAAGRYIKERRFKRMSFKDLLNHWWRNDGKNNRSGFEYLIPRIRKFFGTMRANKITPELVGKFLNGLKDQGLGASSINHHRTIINRVFNFAIATHKFDRNPVKTVKQWKEPPGRDRFLTRHETLKLAAYLKENDPELYAYFVMGTTTTGRKSEFLERPWSDVHLDDDYPYLYIPETKNGHPKKLPLCEIAVDALKNLPSYGTHDYVFPAKPNVRFKENFKKPHAWDLGKRFRRVCKILGIEGLRIHDLRHAGVSALTIKGVPDNQIRLLSGHRSRELERYQHLSDKFRDQTVNLIAKELFSETDTRTDTVAKTGKKEESEKL